MANLSTYGANAILNGTAMPATLYVQLHLDDPTAAGTANIATVTTRKAFTRTTATVGVSSNVALMEWLLYSTTESLTHISIWDAASGGNCWWVDEIEDGPAEAVAGQTTEIPINTLIMTMLIWA